MLQKLGVSPCFARYSLTPHRLIDRFTVDAQPMSFMEPDIGSTVATYQDTLPSMPLTDGAGLWLPVVAKLVKNARRGF